VVLEFPQILLVQQFFAVAVELVELISFQLARQVEPVAVVTVAVLVTTLVLEQ
jgi:hypothetical protein